MRNMENADSPLNVLFLCTGNSARSIMAECALNREGKGRFQGFSAGSQPTGTVNPYALALLSKLNYPTEGLRSKSWDEFAESGAPKLDYIFTVCDNAAGEVCPIWPGQPISAHWGLPDPAAVTESDEAAERAFSKVFHQLNDRIRDFVSLPLDSLDQPDLQQRLDAIGQS